MNEPRIYITENIKGEDEDGLVQINQALKVLTDDFVDGGNVCNQTVLDLRAWAVWAKQQLGVQPDRTEQLEAELAKRDQQLADVSTIGYFKGAGVGKDHMQVLKDGVRDLMAENERLKTENEYLDTERNKKGKEVLTALQQAYKYEVDLVLHKRAFELAIKGDGYCGTDCEHYAVNTKCAGENCYPTKRNHYLAQAKIEQEAAQALDGDRVGYMGDVNGPGCDPDTV